MPPLSPLAAHHRARIAHLSKTRSADDPEIIDEKREFATAKIQAYIERVVAEAPPLTNEQFARLRVLLEPARRKLAQP
ncbi:hypothetical protein [Mycobacterium sp. 3-98]|uniref:hypothetical protein n=1 Tax=Mycobacterium sp. 3-98 TaxID=3042317 RepID=UPI002DDA0D2B|nr:hypothetical protein [Mycobacterium sp. 3-98]WSE46435.1 hypothetical protein QGN30_00195 [Mycobacterium sp. 3-98]